MYVHELSTTSYLHMWILQKKENNKRCVDLTLNKTMFEERFLEMLWSARYHLASLGVLGGHFNLNANVEYLQAWLVVGDSSDQCKVCQSCFFHLILDGLFWAQKSGHVIMY